MWKTKTKANTRSEIKDPVKQIFFTNIHPHWNAIWTSARFNILSCFSKLRITDKAISLPILSSFTTLPSRKILSNDHMTASKYKTVCALCGDLMTHNMLQDPKGLLEHILLISIIKYISKITSSSFKVAEVIAIVTCLNIRQILWAKLENTA